MALVRLPMLPRSACTLDDPARSIDQHFAAAVQEYNLIDATFMHGFSSARPWTISPLSSAARMHETTAILH